MYCPRATSGRQMKKHLTSHLYSVWNLKLKLNYFGICFFFLDFFVLKSRTSPLTIAVLQHLPRYIEYPSNAVVKIISTLHRCSHSILYTFKSRTSTLTTTEARSDCLSINARNAVVWTISTASFMFLFDYSVLRVIPTDTHFSRKMLE